jgi:hypothetical protein
MVTVNISRLSNDELITHIKNAAADERRATVHLVALLAEFDARRLYLGEGCSSLFAYCTSVLHLSEHAAYHRIEAARAARQFPVILDRLAEGAVTLTAVGLLRQHLTAKNHLALLDGARNKSKRDVERLIAGLAPKADIAPMVRRLAIIKPLSATRDRRPSAAASMTPPQHDWPGSAQPQLALDAATPGLEARVESHSSVDRYLLRLTISGEAHTMLQRARDLLRHTIPNGDPATIIERALTMLVAQLERAKTAATSRPRPDRTTAGTGRHVPAAVRRTVWARDGGRCTFVGTEGRCQEAGRLEFHHVTPFARGGRTDATNLALRCRAHNVYDARLAFGDREPWLSGGV